MVVAVQINASVFVEGEHGLVKHRFDLTAGFQRRSDFDQGQAAWSSFQLFENDVFEIWRRRHAMNFSSYLIASGRRDTPRRRDAVGLLPQSFGKGRHRTD